MGMSMKTIPIEIFKNLCESVVINPAFKPRFLVRWGIFTTCNFAFQLIAGVFGLKFTGMANKIIRQIRSSPDFRKVDFYDAHCYVNKGALVVAVEEALIHGHLVCLCPGPTVWSGKWSIDCPLCAGVGKRMGIEGINWQFRHIPDIYVYDPKPPISQDDLEMIATTDFPDKKGDDKYLSNPQPKNIC